MISWLINTLLLVTAALTAGGFVLGLLVGMSKKEKD